MEKYNFRINGHDYEVGIESITGEHAQVRVNGAEYSVEIVAEADGTLNGASGGSAAMRNETGTATGRLSTDNGADAGRKASSGSPDAAGKGGETVTAPLPGVIVDVKVKVGDSVKAGQTVAVLEAMKMENEIESPVSGTVTSVNAAKGDSVLEGAAIVTVG